MGLVRIELTTSSLSVTRSNRLSYSPYRGTNLHQTARSSFGPLVFPELGRYGLAGGGEQGAAFAPQIGRSLPETT